MLVSFEVLSDYRVDWVERDSTLVCDFLNRSFGAIEFMQLLSMRCQHFGPWADHQLLLRSISVTRVNVFHLNVAKGLRILLFIGTDTVLKDIIWEAFIETVGQNVSLKDISLVLRDLRFLALVPTALRKEMLLCKCKLTFRYDITEVICRFTARACNLLWLGKVDLVGNLDLMLRLWTEILTKDVWELVCWASLNGLYSFVFTDKIVAFINLILIILICTWLLISVLRNHFCLLTVILILLNEGPYTNLLHRYCSWSDGFFLRK